MRRYCLIMFVLVVCPVLWTTAQTVEYTKRTRNEVREGPGSYYQLLKILPKGVAVPIVKREGGWVNFSVGAVVGKSSAWLSKNCLIEGKQVDLLRNLRFEWQSPNASPSAVAAAIRGFALRFGKVSPTVLDTLLDLRADLFTPEEYRSFVQDLRAQKSKESKTYTSELSEILREYDVTNASEGMCFGIASRLLSKGLVTERKLTKYVNLLAATLASATPLYDVPFRVYIVKGEEPRAYSIPGGFIILGEGLVRTCADEAELAALIAHEMVHISANHGYREQYERRYRIRVDEKFDELDQESGQNVDSTETDLEEIVQEAYDEVVKPRLQGYEEEADRGAAMLLAAAGYDPTALSGIIAKTGLAVKKQAADGMDNPLLYLDFEKRNAALLEFLQANFDHPGGVRNKDRFRRMLQ